MKVTVIGGGNIGTQLACHSAEKGHDVIIFTSKPDKFSPHPPIINENNEELHKGIIESATSNPEDAFKNADS